ncbi:MAG: polysaccharide deacetylase family protein [Bacteroidetes bacterium]|nr:polysaccharide deacetylase family protein [Bacteroidota bacterium]
MSAIHVTVWSQRDSPRLRYVLDWLLGERLGLSYTLTNQEQETIRASHALSYGWLNETVVSVHSGTSLLWEEGVQVHGLKGVEWQGLFTLFLETQSRCDIAFDLFAGIFYLLSRYEEYLPFASDKHGRYPAQQSILYEQLERPVVDEWVEAFRAFLEQAWQIQIPRKPFSFQPSYDIDIAWSYRFKGWKRMLGAASRELLQGNGGSLKQRWRVCRGREKDPYDSFAFILGQHMMDKQQPLYFVLAALQVSAFDKNISPLHPRMSGLIHSLATGGRLGLHPSYYSNKYPQRLLAEKASLERILQQPVLLSRQHFIRLRFPGTYRALTEAGIEEDFSMGYSTHFGFRAGTSHSFLAYDLKAEQCLLLRVHPFCFMDSTGRFDLGLTGEEAFSRLRLMVERLKLCGGKLITVLHNYSLGTDAAWAGWQSEYEQFLASIRQA